MQRHHRFLRLVRKEVPATEIDMSDDVVDWRFQYLGIHLGTWQSCVEIDIRNPFPNSYDPNIIRRPRSIHFSILQDLPAPYYADRIWPSHGSPLDEDGRDYDPENVGRLTFCEPVPIKLGFYVLAKEHGGPVDIQHPAAQVLQLRDCPELRRKLYSGLVAMLGRIAQESERVMYPRGCRAIHRVRNIGITVPAQWGDAFKKVYLKALADFHPEYLREAVVFITEPEAWMHHAHGYKKVSNAPQKSQPKLQLYLNFGNHMMDTAMFWVGPEESCGPKAVRDRFFRMGDPIGVPSGPGLRVVQYAMDIFRDRFFEEVGRFPSKREKHIITTNITPAVRRWGPNYSSRDSYVYRFSILTDEPVAREVLLWMSDREIRHIWESAYRPSLQLVVKQFALVEKIIDETEAPVRVDITGSAQWYGSPLKTEVQGLAREMGLFEDMEMVWHYGSFPPVRGGIKAARERMTTEEFITQGAGVALQKKLAGAAEWEDNAALLCYFDNVKKEYRPNKYNKAKFELAGTQFRLLCNPLHHVFPPRDSHATKARKPPIKTPISKYQSYVLFEGMPTAEQRGKYVCEAAFEGSSDKMFLVVTIEHGEPSNRKATKLRLRLQYNVVPRRAEAILEPAEEDDDKEITDTA
ncbi:hypothetical protein B0T20DRAFT_468099 [Sordaria brevicollis]|uniref:Uncharacterized protein n=1 Tax=Sordaria brevicollis TaxID=83679 RepID=A0AAE0PGZ7_SORBR|nr:hypothetical protein B0T20DRAFT_468099 [Sordaria brevicollis]